MAWPSLKVCKSRPSSLSHLVEDEAGRPRRGLKIALVSENAAAFGQRSDHQPVPGNEDLGVHRGRDAFLACGEKDRPAGCELSFELALVAGKQLGGLLDRPRQIEDVVIFPVSRAR